MVNRSAQFVPTAAQRELINAPGTRFVDACPGSGKTRAIVARYERLAIARQRRGCALLSFTNAAVDEVVQRCTDPHNLAPPNFVGTFDSFINRFISGPWLAKRLGRYPQFIDTWGAIRAARFSVDSLPTGVHFSLDQFDWDADGRYRFNPKLASGWSGNVLKAAYGKGEGDIDARATELRRTIIEKYGVVSSSASRHLAVNLLRDSLREAWLEIVAGRFAEVIIDEAQDCGIEELAVLDAVLDAGVAVIAVADLDQAIFEFRHADPASVAEFADRIGRGTRLNGNFRSSPAIVALGGHLRASGVADQSIGAEKESTIPVRVVSFTYPKEVTTQAKAILADLGLPGESCVVLAHRRSDAAECASASISDSPSRRNVIIIAEARLAIASDVSATGRKRALEDVERVLIKLAGTDEADHYTTQAIIGSLGLTKRWVRDGANRLIYGADPASGRASYTSALRAIVTGLNWPRGVTLSHLNHRLATPPENDWESLDRATRTSSALRWNTIHGAKGREHDAVVVVIPKKLPGDANGDTCLDLWEKQLDGESRRVLYVGATRAKKLLILAVHAEHYERVATLASWPEHDVAHGDSESAFSTRSPSSSARRWGTGCPGAT